MCPFVTNRATCSDRRCTAARLASRRTVRRRKVAFAWPARTTVTRVTNYSNCTRSATSAATAASARSFRKRLASSIPYVCDVFYDHPRDECVSIFLAEQGRPKRMQHVQSELHRHVLYLRSPISRPRQRQRRRDDSVRRLRRYA